MKINLFTVFTAFFINNMSVQMVLVVCWWFRWDLTPVDLESLWWKVQGKAQISSHCRYINTYSSKVVTDRANTSSVSFFKK